LIEAFRRFDACTDFASAVITGKSLRAGEIAKHWFTLTTEVIFSELYTSATRLTGITVDSAIGATDGIINIRAEAEIGRFTAFLDTSEPTVTLTVSSALISTGYATSTLITARFTIRYVRLRTLIIRAAFRRGLAAFASVTALIILSEAILTEEVTDHRFT
jgi:hypothetical protein